MSIKMLIEDPCETDRVMAAYPNKHTGLNFIDTIHIVPNKQGKGICAEFTMNFVPALKTNDLWHAKAG